MARSIGGIIAGIGHPATLESGEIAGGWRNPWGLQGLRTVRKMGDNTHRVYLWTSSPVGWNWTPRPQ